MDKFFKKEVKITNGSEKTEIPSDVKVEIKEKELEDKTEIKIADVSENQTALTTPENTEVIQPNKSLPHEQKETEKEVENAPLTWKEMKALTNAKYEEKVAHNPKFKKIYLIQNKKTKQIAEIRAASSFHACNLIGWRANKVVLLGEKLADEIVPETQNSSGNGNQ